MRTYARTCTNFSRGAAIAMSRSQRWRKESAARSANANPSHMACRNRALRSGWCPRITSYRIAEAKAVCFAARLSGKRLSMTNPKSPAIARHAEVRAVHLPPHYRGGSAPTGRRGARRRRAGDAEHRRTRATHRVRKALAQGDHDIEDVPRDPPAPEQL